MTIKNLSIKGYHKAYLYNGLLSPILLSSSSEYWHRTSSSVSLAFLRLIFQRVNSKTKHANMPAEANAKEVPNPVGYLGASFSIYI